MRSFQQTSVLLAGMFIALANAQESQQQGAWPRQREVDGHTLTMYQPQIDSWENQKQIAFRTAISIQQPDAEDLIYGVLTVQATTLVNKEERRVLLTNPQSQIHFPDLDAAEAQAFEQLVRAALPNRQTMEVDLDRILSHLSLSEIQNREIQLSLDPPPIFYSDKPAIAVIFMGDPKFKPVEGTSLLFATNTNWDVFLETGSSQYFLLNNDMWLTTADPVKGPWTVASSLPADLSKLPDDENWADVRQHLTPGPAGVAPEIFVSTGPAELIVTEGAAEMTPIPGTKLMFVANSDSDLFFNTSEGKYYFLVAGRWFSAAKLDGPWSAATSNLPDDFAQIPDDHQMAEVLASVPGTPEAEEAVIQASIPQKATVNRADAKVDVVFDGTPEFKPIDGSQGVSYGINTTFTVLSVGGQYYCCESGVWFVAPQPTGPYVVCVNVPESIYSIPASSPVHNVTYVYVYDYNDAEVTCGYTSGYTGAYIANGLVMFGAGIVVGALLDNNDWYRWHCSPCYYSYGCHARYSYHAGGFVRTTRYYGPYGGVGYGARYNPVTGRYARGAYAYGPYRSAGVGSAYNPVTGRYARGGYVSGPRGTVAVGGTYNARRDRGAATRQGRTPYGSWGSSVVSNGDNWARFGHRSTNRGTTAGFRTSEGASGVVRKTDNGWRYAGKSRDGDIYAGGDGRVYRRDNNNQWQTRSNRSRDWNSTGTRSYSKDQARTRPERWSDSGSRQTTSVNRSAERSRQTQATNRSSGNTSRSRTTRSSSSSLNRDAWSRDRGNKISSRSKNSHHRSGSRHGGRRR